MRSIVDRNVVMRRTQYSPYDPSCVCKSLVSLTYAHFQKGHAQGIARKSDASFTKPLRSPAIAYFLRHGNQPAGLDYILFCDRMFSIYRLYVPHCVVLKAV